MYNLRMIILLLLLPFVSYAQKWEIGFHTGGTNYMGDLAPNIVFSETNYAFGAFIKKNINPFISNSLAFTKGMISGSDLNFPFLRERNLSFFSEITEFAYIFEFNFFRFAIGLHPNKFTPYTFIGLASYFNQPKTNYNGTIVILGPLDTEGVLIQNGKKAYGIFHLSIPMGGGFKFKISNDFNIAINLGYRYTFNDYLDDVSATYFNVDELQQKYGDISAILSDRSENVIGFDGKQRGREDMSDWYIFTGISLSFKIKNKVCFEF